MGTLTQDLRYGLQILAKNPEFTVVAVLTLALGIGANTAVFSVIDTLLLRAPHFKHLDRLVSLRESNRQKFPFDVDPSPGNFLDWREQSHSFDQLAAWRNWYFTLAEPQARVSAAESVRGVSVSPNFLSMIGVQPSLGRTFQSDEEVPGKNHTVILSDGLWKRRFGADRAIVGRTMLIDGTPFSVIGVLPPDFQFFQPDLDIWMPLAVDAGFHDRQGHSVMVFARLTSGASLEKAQAEMDAIAARIAEAYPDTNGGWQVKVERLYPTASIRALRPALLMLFGAASLVLLIACANVANLFLARAIARHTEITVRVALGASRARLIRQMLTESLLLAIVSGVPAVIVAHQGINSLVPLLPHVGTNRTVDTFNPVSPVLDGRMLSFSLAVAVLTGLVFGVIPALQATRPETLRMSAPGSQRPHAGRLLMVAELALAIVLLTGAALLIESLLRLQHVDVGFRSDHLLTMQVWLPKAKYSTTSAIRGFYEQAARRIGAVPGVLGASGISYRPFLGMGTGVGLDIEGRPPSRSGEQPGTEYRVVTPGFLRVLGQPLVTGRDFTEHDDANADGVAIVNEAMARRYWPTTNPIGQRLRPAFRRSDVPWEMDAAPRWLTVVGVVRNIKGLIPNERDQSQLYVSSLQFPFAFMFLIVRTVIPSLSAAAAVQDQIHSIDPDQPVCDIRTMEAAMSASVPRFNVVLLGVFALIAVILAAVGVYGVSSYAVNQRRQEIGVRMALGARSGDVLAMIMREALALGLIGVGLGLIASLAVTRTMSGLLYGVEPTDLRAYLGAPSLLLSVVLIASYVPAHRAAGLDPAVALRG